MPDSSEVELRPRDARLCLGRQPGGPALAVRVGGRAVGTASGAEASPAAPVRKWGFTTLPLSGQLLANTQLLALLRVTFSVLCWS